jgi:hypothetical protein
MDRKTTRSPRTRPMRTALWLLTASLVALGAGPRPPRAPRSHESQGRRSRPVRPAPPASEVSPRYPFEPLVPTPEELCQQNEQLHDAWQASRPNAGAFRTSSTSPPTATW